MGGKSMYSGSTGGRYTVNDGCKIDDASLDVAIQSPAVRVVDEPKIVVNQPPPPYKTVLIRIAGLSPTAKTLYLLGAVGAYLAVRIYQNLWS